MALVSAPPIEFKRRVVLLFANRGVRFSTDLRDLVATWQIHYAFSPGQLLQEARGMFLTTWSSVSGISTLKTGIKSYFNAMKQRRRPRRSRPVDAHVCAVGRSCLLYDARGVPGVLRSTSDIGTPTLG